MSKQNKSELDNFKPTSEYAVSILNSAEVVVSPNYCVEYSHINDAAECVKINIEDEHLRSQILIYIPRMSFEEIATRLIDGIQRRLIDYAKNEGRRTERKLMEGKQDEQTK